jgi:hypothetical protein
VQGVGLCGAPGRFVDAVSGYKKPAFPEQNAMPTLSQAQV